MKWNSNNQIKALERDHFNNNSRIRPDFRGRFIHSPVNGELIMYYGDSWDIIAVVAVRRALSLLIFGLCIVGVLISTAGVYYGRYQLRQFNSIAIYVQYIASGGNCLVNLLYNLLFSHIGYWITILENHRTDDSFYSSYSGTASYLLLLPNSNKLFLFVISSS